MTDLRTTIPLDPPEAVRTEASGAPPGVAAVVRLSAPSVEPRFVGGSTTDGGERFEVRATLGVGATGQVLAVYDRDLRREVAVKVLRDAGSDVEQLRDFLDEARTTAELSHPNVLPVHDLHVSEDGRPCFSMTRLEGTTLGEALITSTPDARDERIRSPNAVVTIFIAVCQAMRYAHARGIVHQDLKPDNILLGGFGEVVVLDWGSAARVGADGRITTRLYGTPMYMSPEQARRSHSERRSDVYALGATLFHALALRPPTWADDVEAFWAKKREGIIDPLTADERRAVPDALASIALAAMHPDPERRYASIDAMAADLVQYQAGLAVSVHRDPLLTVLRRWYAANRRLCWGMAAALLVVAAAIALLAHEKAKERTRWTVVMDETFDRPLGDRWHAVMRNWSAGDVQPVPLDDPMHFPPEPGAVAMRVANGFLDLVHAYPVLGDLRVEWDVRAESGAQGHPLNLNAFLHAGDRESGYTFHIAAHGDPSLVQLTRGKAFTLQRHRLAQPLQGGRTYRMRMEKEGQVLRLAIDGEVQLEYHDLDAEVPSTGTFGFDAVEWPRMVIDNVRVMHKPLAQRVTAIAYARNLMELRLYPQAYAQFADILTSYGDGEQGPDALFGMVVCSIRQERRAHALELLDRFTVRYPGHPLVPYCDRERLAALPIGPEGDAARDEVVARLAPYRGQPVALAAAVRLGHAMIDRCCERLPRTRPEDSPWRADTVERIRATVPRMRAWMASLGVALDHTDFVHRTTDVLRRLGQQELLLELYSDVARSRGVALCDVGRFAEALAEPALPREFAVTALVALGRYDEVIDGNFHYLHQRDAMLAKHGLDGALERLPNDSVLLALAGRHEEAFAKAGDVVARTAALIAAGRLDEALATARTSWQRADVLLRMGRYDEALREPGDDDNRPYVAVMRMLRNGDEAPARALLERMRGRDPQLWHDGAPFCHLLMAPLLAKREGESVDARTALRPLLERHRALDAQRLWFIAARIVDDIDDAAFRQQPVRHGAEGRLLLAHGMRHEFAGRWAEALASYRAFLAHPTPRMLLGDIAEDYVRWRVGELERRGR